MNPSSRRDMSRAAVCTDRSGTGQLPPACTDRSGHRFVTSVFRPNYEICERCGCATRVVQPALRGDSQGGVRNALTDSTGWDHTKEGLCAIAATTVTG